MIQKTNTSKTKGGKSTLDVVLKVLLKKKFQVRKPPLKVTDDAIIIKYEIIEILYLFNETTHYKKIKIRTTHRKEKSIVLDDIRKICMSYFNLNVMLEESSLYDTKDTFSSYIRIVSS